MHTVISSKAMLLNNLKSKKSWKVERKNLHIRWAECKNARNFPSQRSLVCCRALPEVCWYDVNYTCSAATAKSSPSKRRTSFFFSVTYLLCTHAHYRHPTNSLRSCERFAYTTRSTKISFSCAPLASRFIQFFLLFLFRLWLCHIARDENAKSGAKECSQYLVFCQTWSTRNRGISWKLY